MDEPQLTDKDRRIWRRWKRQCLTWAKSATHQQRVQKAVDAIFRMHHARPDAYVAWSAGKDSTALAHLALVACGIDAHAMAIKDDLDFPGERRYIETLSNQWGVDVDVLEPDFSLQGYLAEHADELHADEDLHGRAAGFADRAFYGVIDDYRQAHDTPGVYLGLRAEESDGRAGNASRGSIYTKKSGETVCQPIRWWEARDVYAYLFSRDIPLHPVYRCVRLHESPGRVRKSWWLPGAHARHGATVWLKTYWPSLYSRLCDLLPDTKYHG